jgi:hypothetical protein
VSHRRYVVRRIVVAVCALLVLGGIVGLIAWAVSGDGDGDGALGTDETSPAAVASTDDATTTAAKPTATTATATTRRTTVPVAATEPDDTTVPETSEAPAETTEPQSGGAPDSSVAEGPTYNLGLRARCQMQEAAQLGDSGSDVACLEQRLEQVTTSGVTFEVDDVFDEETDAAVREFQEANDLVVDGIVGAETAQLLSIWNPSTS